MRVLVTGGAGFLGSHVVQALLAAGHAPTVLDDLSTGRRANVPDDVPLVVCDVRDPVAVRAAFQRARPSVVVHLAAQADVRRATAEPALDAEVNVVGGIHVLSAAAEAGAARIVYASSAAVYGDPERLPLDEDHPIRPLSAYGVSKHAFEHYLLSAARAGGPAAAILRFANLYGPRQDPHGEAGVVAIFAGAMLRGAPCRIFGDGDQTRDFVYAADAAAAIVRSLDGAADGRVLNIGSGEETSVRALFQALAAATGYHHAPSFAPARPGEIRRMAFAAARAASALGWRPVVGLADGLERTVAWLAKGAGPEAVHVPEDPSATHVAPAPRAAP